MQTTKLFFLCIHFLRSKVAFTVLLLIGWGFGAMPDVRAQGNVTVVDSAVSADSLQVPQDTLWKLGGDMSLTLAQVSLANWAAGGENTLSGFLEFHAFADYEKDKVSWENTFNMGLGALREGGSEDPFKKNNDQLILTSRYSQQLRKNLALTGLLDMRTQILPGYRYSFVDSLNMETRKRTSRFLAPGYLVTSLGVSYVRKDLLKLNFSPISGKFTLVLDDSLSAVGAYGVVPGTTSRSQFGYSITLNLKKQFTESIEFRTNLLLFSDYQEMDVNWESYLRFKINEYLSSYITNQVIWDRDIEVNRDDGTLGPAVQLRTAINVGLAFDF